MERLDLLKDGDLFAALPVESLARVAEVAREVLFPAGSTVVREGDPGDGLYIVVRGDVQVYVTRQGGEEIVLAHLGPGETFGEQYLLGESGRRTASVRCRSETELLHLSEATCRALLQRHPAIGQTVRARAEHYDQARAARRSDLARLLRLERPARDATTRRYPAGTVVFREGDAADAFYFILSGTATVYSEATPDTPIRILERGHGFGELALINDAPRTASVRADSDLEVELVPRERFLRLHEQSPAVRDRMAALSFVYRLPDRGVALQWAGRHAGEESIERSYRLDDGSTWRSTFLVGGSVFRLEATSARSPNETTEHGWLDPASGHSRTVRLDETGRITGLFSVGTWGRLPALIEAALDGTPLAADRFASFAATGAVYFDAPPRAPAATPTGTSEELDRLAHRTVCFCMQVVRAAIEREIRAGCHTFEELRCKTGCGSVCGGCEPAVKDLLGHADWTPVTATAIPVRDDLRCIRLYPRGGTWTPFAAGQHLIIEGYIEGNWIARAYTIISPPQEKRYLELCVKREPKGLLSRWLFSGDLDDKALHISAPRGDVRWQSRGRPTALFVAGIGITPALAIVRAALASGGSDRVHVDYSAHSASQLAFRDELEQAAAARDHITLKTRATGADGRITADEVQTIARQLPEADFYLCGPASFMASVRGALMAAGVAAERISIEVFVHAGPAAAPDDKPRPEAGPTRMRTGPLAALCLGALLLVAAFVWYLATHFPDR